MEVENIVDTSKFLEDVIQLSQTGNIGVHAVLVSHQDEVVHAAEGLEVFNEEEIGLVSRAGSAEVQVMSLHDVLSEGKVAIVAIDNHTPNLLIQQIWSISHDGLLQYKNEKGELETEHVFPPGAGVIICLEKKGFETSPLANIISMTHCI